MLGRIQPRLNDPWQFICAGRRLILLAAFMNESRGGCLSLAESGQPPDDLQHPSYHSALDKVDTLWGFPVDWPLYE